MKVKCRNNFKCKIKAGYIRSKTKEIEGKKKRYG